MSSKNVFSVCVKVSIAVLAFAAFTWTAPVAQAGAIPYAGKMIMRGTSAAASATASGGMAAAGEATSAAKATGGFLGNAANAAGNALASVGKTAGNRVEEGAGAIAYGAKATPGIVARKTTAGAKTLWHAIW